MPHQCVSCKKYYEDGASQILSGCTCGAKLFFFIRKEVLNEAAKTVDGINDREKRQIEEDVYDMIGLDPEKDRPVVLDFESIRVAKSGKYEIDLVNLFKKDPVIFKLDDGKYVIDIQSTFEQFRKKR